MSTVETERIDFVLLYSAIAVALPFWVVGLLVRLKVPVPPIIGIPLMGVYAVSGLGAILVAVLELGGVTYLILRPGTLFDLRRRAQLGMPYRRLIPHATALGVLVLSYLLRQELHITEVLDALGSL